MNPNNVIDVTDLWRRYGPPGKGGFSAVRGVSFSVARGELFALLGTNGAGKTSTVELVEGLAKPTQGSIRLFGGYDPYTDRVRVRPRTGVMLQEGGFASDLTVAETVDMWAKCTTNPRPVDEAMSMTGLAARAGTLVKNLSGGEKRRLDLSLAVLGYPELLFLDEPTAGMDPEGRRQTWQLIEELQEQDTTIVLTTHYLEEAERLADRLAIMHRGRIAATGTVAEIVSAHPSYLFFRLPPDVGLTDLPPQADLGAMNISESEGTVHLATQDLQFTATEALMWARDKGIGLDQLHARSASLEEAFLHIAQSEETKETGA
ncbi:multidrug ABC transporter ATP-binding protein [Streptomyces fuscichromogenes]|uniref:Multidrug ABC transporter ATP-binding protein n=1 Tax=Streptomyces fuscichromogenes TaxID=1324013 RepID=A0A918CT14_9ACTN|nr:multidrug ABC transporter ATP-binding protein [Streptomyces fuscichromogenes]